MNTATDLLLVGVLFGCGAEPELGLYHRAEALACEGHATTSDAICASHPLPDAQCTTSSDCTAGEGGGCFDGYPECTCRYDACQSDADCSTGQLCACAGVEPFGSQRCTPSGEGGRWVCSTSYLAECD